MIPSRAASRTRVRPLVVAGRSQRLRVGPVHLSVGGEVIAGIALERLARLRVRELEEPDPLGTLELLLRHDRALVGRAVAREDSLLEEIAAGRIDGKLEVAVDVSIRDPPLEGSGELVAVDDLDLALEFASESGGA